MSLFHISSIDKNEVKNLAILSEGDNNAAVSEVNNQL